MGSWVCAGVRQGHPRGQTWDRPILHTALPGLGNTLPRRICPLLRQTSALFSHAVKKQNQHAQGKVEKYFNKSMILNFKKSMLLLSAGNFTTGHILRLFLGGKDPIKSCDSCSYPLIWVVSKSRPNRQKILKIETDSLREGVCQTIAVQCQFLRVIFIYPLCATISLNCVCFVNKLRDLGYVALVQFLLLHR